MYAVGALNEIFSGRQSIGGSAIKTPSGKNEKAPALGKCPPIPPEVVLAAKRGELVLFVGAGLSRLVGMPSWDEMAKKHLECLRQKEALNYSDVNQLRSLNLQKQLSIAMDTAEGLGLKLDLADGLRLGDAKVKASRIYEYVNSIGCVCVTTNYDELLNPHDIGCQDDGSTTRAGVRRITEKEEFKSGLSERGAVIHLHGSVKNQDSMIVSTREYLEHYADPNVRGFLGELFSDKTVLFLGYGLEEAEILEHILRSGLRRNRTDGVGKLNKVPKEEPDSEAKKGQTRFVLQGFYRSEQPLYEKLFGYYRSAFGIHVIGYDKDLKGYSQQEEIIRDWADNITVQPLGLAAVIKLIARVLPDESEPTPELTPDEKKLIEKVVEFEAAQTFFFGKAKGLKWFDALDAKQFFDPKANPAPVLVEEKGYYDVPPWPVTAYLVATSPELRDEDNREYAERFMSIIRSVTQRAKKEKFHNYRTWMAFTKIVSNIPVDLIKLDDLALVDYWLQEQACSDVVAQKLAHDWLKDVLLDAIKGAPRDDKNGRNDQPKDIAVQLLTTLYEITFTEETEGSNAQQAAHRLGDWSAEKVTTAIAGPSGEAIGESAVRVFKDQLEELLRRRGNDQLSYFWRPAIEDHEQNSDPESVQNILIVGLRDSLMAWVDQGPTEEAKSFIEEMLDSEFFTFRRIALHVIRLNYRSLKELTGQLIAQCALDDKLRHEMWHLLHEWFAIFPQPQRDLIKESISEIRVENNEGGISKTSTAYQQWIWLSAIKDQSEELTKFYRDRVEILGSEPEHADFPVWHSSVEWVGQQSPKSPEELLAMDVDELVAYLKEYEGSDKLDEPGIEGLALALTTAAREVPLVFETKLSELSKPEKWVCLDNAYLNAFVVAFSQLWDERNQLPWDVLWETLLKFCNAIVESDEFWSSENSEQREQHIANRHSVVTSIARLISAGTRSDDHAFPQNLLEQAQGLILTLLGKQEGEEFESTYNAVYTATNSPRGHCLTALINLALRRCRLALSASGGHESVWCELQPTFDSELELSHVRRCEFVVLVVEYLPNFRYMSKSWVTDNLPQIFDRQNRMKWLRAMQAFADGSSFDEELYDYLQQKGLFIQALDEEELPEQVAKKIVQNGVVAYLCNHESIEADESLIRQILSRAQNNELDEVIRSVGLHRQHTDSADLRDKVMGLWPKLWEVISIEDVAGRKLASRLTKWVSFITEVDGSNRHLILELTQFAEDNYNGHYLLEWIARISATQPNEVITIWQELLQSSAPDYPEQAIRDAFVNLIGMDREGEGYNHALEIAGLYAKHRKYGPAQWLQEIRQGWLS